LSAVSLSVAFRQADVDAHIDHVRAELVQQARSTRVRARLDEGFCRNAGTFLISRVPTSLNAAAVTQVRDLQR
jgi:hypothetical protein